MYEVWICRRADGARWRLASLTPHYGIAESRCERWDERGYKAAIFDQCRHLLGFKH